MSVVGSRPYLLLLEFFFLFETGSYYAVLVGLELSMQSRLALNSEEIHLFLPPDVGIKGVHHHTWVLLKKFFRAHFKVCCMCICLWIFAQDYRCPQRSEEGVLPKIQAGNQAQSSARAEQACKG